jgi:hypothetical protein
MGLTGSAGGFSAAAAGTAEHEPLINNHAADARTKA